MRTSTGSPLFSDFRSDLSRAVRFPTAGQGNDDSGNEIENDAGNFPRMLRRLTAVSPFPSAVEWEILSQVSLKAMKEMMVAHHFSSELCPLLSAMLLFSTLYGP